MVERGPALLLTLAAVVLRPRRPVLLLAGWVALSTVMLSLPTVHFERNLTPVLGALAALAAVGASAIVDVVSRAQWRRALLPCVAGVAVLATVVVHTARFAEAERSDLTDYQGASRRWLAAHVPDGSSALLEQYAPWLDPDTHRLAHLPYAFNATPEQLADEDYVVITSQGSGRYVKTPGQYPVEAAKLQALIDSACRRDHFDDGQGYSADVLAFSCDP